jgi:putative hemolysin
VRLFGGDPEPSTARRSPTRRSVIIIATQSRRTPMNSARSSTARFEIADRTLEEVMVPRNDVIVIDAEATCDEALALLVETGHSRAPVAEKRNLDRPVGMVGLRSLVVPR